MGKLKRFARAFILFLILVPVAIALLAYWEELLARRDESVFRELQRTGAALSEYAPALGEPLDRYTLGSQYCEEFALSGASCGVVCLDSANGVTEAYVRWSQVDGVLGVARFLLRKNRDLIARFRGRPRAQIREIDEP